MNKRLKQFLIAGSFGALSSISFTASAVNYGEALQKSIYFYEAQQAGKLPEWNRVEWRGDSVLDDGSDNGVDLSGGWFDAGDHVKFGFPMASTATMLAWGVVEYPEAYIQSGQMPHIKNNLKFVADYFIKAHTAPNELYGQVGSGSDDHAWWGSPEVIHLTSRAASNRPSFKIDESCPGSDLAGETAAALAAISMIFKDDEPNYAATLLQHARELYAFANSFRGKYSDCITDATAFYNSWSGYRDELVWSALWLYQATQDQSYLENAINAYDDLNTEPQSDIKSYRWTHAWDDKGYGSYVLLAKLTDDATYREDTERWLDYWTTGYEGQRVPYTAGGLAQLDTWGANRYAANTSFIALIYSDYLKENYPAEPKAATYYDFAVSQLEYIMGDNPSNISFQIGMSEDGPRNPHHRGAHGTWADSLQVPETSRHLLVGALVGGPGSGDAYEDDRGDYIANEVATDYNAAFTGALARLYLDFGGEPIPEDQFPKPEQRDLEFFVEAKVNASGPRFIELATRVYNQSAWPARNGDNLKYRYFVDLTEEMSLGYSANNITVSTAYNQASSVSQLQSWGNPNDHIYYTEVDFSNVNIFPGGQSDYRKEVQLRISLPATSNASEWSNNEDPSWDNYSSAFIKASKIALYDGEELVWGSEPSPGCGSNSGVNCAPEASDIYASTQEGQAVSIVLAASDSDGFIESYTVSDPTNGTITGSGAERSYQPNAGFVGTDAFSYFVTDNEGLSSAPATVNVEVSEIPLPYVEIIAPAENSNITLGSSFQFMFTLENAASIRVLMNGAELQSNVSASPVTLTAPNTLGQFLIEIIAQNNNGDDTDATASIILNAVEVAENTPPEAQMSLSVSGLQVVADASNSVDADGDPLSYEWNFDGVIKQGVIVSHTFSTSGTYDVSLTVSDGEDETSTAEIITLEHSPADASCEFMIGHEWADGFVANIVLTNTGSTSIENWTVSWDFPESVSMQHGWSAEFSGVSTITATPLSWNSSIVPGQSIEFGFVGQKPAIATTPEITINGSICP